MAISVFCVDSEVSTASTCKTWCPLVIPLSTTLTLTANLVSLWNGSWQTITWLVYPKHLIHWTSTCVNLLCQICNDACRFSFSGTPLTTKNSSSYIEERMLNWPHSSMNIGFCLIWFMKLQTIIGICNNYVKYQLSYRLFKNTWKMKYHYSKTMECDNINWCSRSVLLLRNRLQCFSTQ